MEIKNWLNRAYRANEIIKLLSEEKEKSFNKAINITAPTDSERIKKSNVNSTEINNIEYSGYSMLLDKKIKELEGIKEEIENALVKLNDNDMYEVLHRRYLLYESFIDISYSIHKSLSHTFKIHRRGIEMMGVILKKDSK